MEALIQQFNKMLEMNVFFFLNTLKIHLFKTRTLDKMILPLLASTEILIILNIKLTWIVLLMNFFLCIYSIKTIFA